uniref:(California timema) hypothetical protein n=1 Tax=Timema californicum TaxID=61474 RepID=A0A7R9J6S6_TIMCA|nr:unnamed protein product [Timema californicum]
MIGAHMLDLAGLKEEKRIEVERKKQEQEDRNKIKNQSEEFQANRKVLENKSQTAKEAMRKENCLEKQESEAKEEVQSYKSLLAEANERINNAMKINDRKGDTPRLIPLDLGPEVRQKVTQFRNAFELIPAGAITMGSFLHPEFIQSPRLPFIQPVRRKESQGEGWRGIDTSKGGRMGKGRYPEENDGEELIRVKEEEWGKEGSTLRCFLGMSDISQKCCLLGLQYAQQQRSEDSVLRLVVCYFLITP